MIWFARSDFFDLAVFKINSRRASWSGRWYTWTLSHDFVRREYRSLCLRTIVSGRKRVWRPAKMGRYFQVKKQFISFKVYKNKSHLRDLVKRREKKMRKGIFFKGEIKFIFNWLLNSTKNKPQVCKPRVIKNVLCSFV